MYTYSMLPARHAEVVIEPLGVDETLKYTSTESMDEDQLYKDLNTRLLTLEIALIIDEESLQLILHDAKGLRFSVGEKEEVLMRIVWLKRLEQVQQNLIDVQTKEEAQKQMGIISSCQTSPLKNQLTTQLVQLIKSLPSKSNETIQISAEDKLMEKAIVEAGDIFINLGKSGRDFVIAEVLQQFGEKSTVEAIQEHTVQLEQRVVSLADVKGRSGLIQQLESLPIKLFSTLSVERKVEIAERLLEVNQWTGLAKLERMTLQWDRFFTNREQNQRETENTIHTSGGQAALTLDIKDVVDGRVQLG